jgi:hypothetical protein
MGIPKGLLPLLQQRNKLLLAQLGMRCQIYRTECSIDFDLMALMRRALIFLWQFFFKIVLERVEESR